ncbi:MAG: substrate binding domain-containing protein, partial [Terriglobia bacterium]
ALHPQLRFDVELSDRAVDIVDEGFDLAIRIGDIGSQSLIGRRIGGSRLICCASPAYLAARGAPTTPSDLTHHACLSYAYTPVRNLWRFVDRVGRSHEVRIAGPVHANSGDMLCALAALGTGICMEPDFVVTPEVRAGRLVQVLSEFAAPTIPINAVYPSRRHLSAKVRSFVEFIAARFVDGPDRS